jgi:hypothetical protein
MAPLSLGPQPIGRCCTLLMTDIIESLVGLLSQGRYVPDAVGCDCSLPWGTQ